MSLVDLTRNCFQSGISASKWIDLCKLYLAKDNSSQSSETIQSNLSNSVLVLYRSYPGDPELQEYLKHAIQAGIVSVPTYVSTLLQAVRSPDLHIPATLDMLCRIALDAHYSSGLPPLGSIVSYTEPSAMILETLQDAIALLRTAYSLPITHFHQLTTSASELMILVYSCVSPDMSHLSTTQAMIYFANANDLLQNFRLSAAVRQVLENFAMSLSEIIGDDAKATREAQMMQSMQLAMGKGDILGPSSNTDIVTFGLELHYMVLNRACDFGAGNGPNAVALLVATYRWTSWTPATFYTQLLLSALLSMSQSSATSFAIWRAFFVGRLPHLLVAFEKATESDNASAGIDWRSAMQAALATVLRRSDLLNLCDLMAARLNESNAAQTQEESRSLSRDLLQQLLSTGLIDQRFAVAVDPGISNDVTPRLQVEAQDANVDLEAYLDVKFIPDTLSTDDLRLWLNRIWRDPGSHAAFANVVSNRFTSLTSSLDVESLSHVCKVLDLHAAALDIVALHVKMSDLIFQALLFLEEYDCETVGDPQTAVSHLGEVVLFIQSTLSRFRLDADTFTFGDKKLSATYLKSITNVLLQEDLRGENATAFNAWFKALFDSSSEGIEDTILRSTRPKTLLRISATLFSHAITAKLDGKIDLDVLNNGVSYFTGPLLNWTLVGVVKALLVEIHQKVFNAPIHLEILQTLLLSPSCPRPVLALCGERILALLMSKQGKSLAQKSTFDMMAVQKAVAGVLGANETAVIQNTITMGVRPSGQEHTRQAIHEALSMARTGKPPFIDVEHNLKITTPTRFLQLFWSEIAVSATLEMENCRRLATFVLTMPRSLSNSSPPLLPIFLHSILPSILTVIDRQDPPERTMSVDLIVTIVSSVLTASLHMELALRSVPGEHKFVLAQPSAVMARRLAGDLRSKKHSPTSSAIVQRLSSSQSFVANFPVFMGELGT